ncbi:hypothetical protein BH10CHL1_BH10CHL1_30760 [soil metagenome]
MVVTLLRFCLILLLALLVGTMFGIWLGYNPESLSAAAYVEQQQNAIRSLNTLLPAMGAVTTVLIVSLAVVMRKNLRACILLIASAVLLVAAGLITRFANQPINAIVITWNPQTPPSNWMELRSAWWYWHILRTIVGIGALALTTIEMLLHRRTAQ